MIILFILGWFNQKWILILEWTLPVHCIFLPQVPLQTNSCRSCYTQGASMAKHNHLNQTRFRIHQIKKHSAQICKNVHQSTPAGSSFYTISNPSTATAHHTILVWPLREENKMPRTRSGELLNKRYRTSGVTRGAWLQIVIYGLFYFFLMM